MPEPATSRTAPALELVRDLGVSHAVSLVVGTLIGSGIFLVPAEMMQAVGSPGMVYLAWVVGGLLSFFGAVTYAELGAMKPQAGGEYVYIRDAYGPLGGFLYAWSWFLVAKPASIATLSTGLVRILGTFALFSFLPKAALVAGITVTWGELVAIAATVFITVVNYVGIRRAGNFQLVMTIIKVAIILGIVMVGLGSTAGAWGNFSTAFPGAKGGFGGFIAALVAALWAYDGWNDLNMVAGEVRHPERAVPMGLIAGVGMVAALYMLVNAAVQYLLPAAAVAASERPASDALAAAVGPWIAGVVSAGMAISILAALNGTVMSGGRIPFAVARDRYFFSALATVHPRFHTPSTALVVQALISILLLLAAGSFRQLFTLSVFAEWVWYMIATSTIFVFRKREPRAARPYRAWGYPVVPVLFMAAAAVLLYFTFVANLRNSAAGVAVILAGVPVFLGFQRRRQARSSSA